MTSAGEHIVNIRLPNSWELARIRESDLTGDGQVKDLQHYPGFNVTFITRWTLNPQGDKVRVKLEISGEMTAIQPRTFIAGPAASAELGRVISTLLGNI